MRWNFSKLFPRSNQPSDTFKAGRFAWTIISVSTWNDRYILFHKKDISTGIIRDYVVKKNYETIIQSNNHIIFETFSHFDNWNTILKLFYYFNINFFYHLTSNCSLNYENNIIYVICFFGDDIFYSWCSI